MWRSSGRGCMVSPSAPAPWAIRPKRSTSGTPVRRELRNSAILLRLTLSLAMTLFCCCGDPLLVRRGRKEPPAGRALVLVDRALVRGGRQRQTDRDRDEPGLYRRLT